MYGTCGSIFVADWRKKGCSERSPRRRRKLRRGRVINVNGGNTQNRRTAVARDGDGVKTILIRTCWARLWRRSLAQREQVRVLDHLSRCTNCREIVSLTATQPGIADAVSVAPARVGWLSWPVLRWGAAVACVVVVGAAVTLRQQHESRQIETTISEQKLTLKSRSLCRAIRQRQVYAAETNRHSSYGQSYETGRKSGRGAESGRNGRCWGWLPHC